MSLSQRYTVEISSWFGTTYRPNHNNVWMIQVLEDISVVKQQSINEKHCFHSLNDRFEELLHHVNDFASTNETLHQDLHSVVTNWNIAEDIYNQRSQVLEPLFKCVSKQTLRKTITHIETNTLQGELLLINRIQSAFDGVFNYYNEKQEFLLILINQLERDLRRAEDQLGLSDTERQSYVNDLENELVKFRLYLSEWSQLVLDKQNLLNEIQSLREFYDLRSSSNKDEILEWKCLLHCSTQDSIYFYQNYLKVLKQSLQNDYEQIIKEQQRDMETVVTMKLQQIEDKSLVNSRHHNINEQQCQEENEQVNNRLHECIKQYDHLESDCRKLMDETKCKRQIIQDLENQARIQVLKSIEQSAHLEYETGLIREEYSMFRDKLDQLIYTIHFSIENELKIYDALLNSVEQDDILPCFAGNDSMQYRSSETSTMNITGVDCSSKCRSSDEIKDMNVAINQEGISIDSFVAEKERCTINPYRHQSDKQQQHTKSIHPREKNEVSNEHGEVSQTTIRIKRKYKGKIIIKSVETQGSFVEIENIGDHSYDLTGWYLDRNVDGRYVNYAFSSFKLDSHQLVRIYGNNQSQVFSSILDDSYISLLASNINDWGTGQQMFTELYNPIGTFRASFEQIIVD